MGSQRAVIPVTVNAWRSNEQSESLEELERSERESRATIRCGMGETIDDALASCRPVPNGLEPFEGEGRTRTVAQEAFESGTVMGRDVDRGIDAEPAGGLPSEHVIGDVALEQTRVTHMTFPVSSLIVGPASYPDLRVQRVREASPLGSALRRGPGVRCAVPLGKAVTAPYPKRVDAQ